MSVSPTALSAIAARDSSVSPTGRSSAEERLARATGAPVPLSSTVSIVATTTFGTLSTGAASSLLAQSGSNNTVSGSPTVVLATSPVTAAAATQKIARRQEQRAAAASTKAAATVLALVAPATVKVAAATTESAAGTLLAPSALPLSTTAASTTDAADALAIDEPTRLVNSGSNVTVTRRSKTTIAAFFTVALALLAAVFFGTLVTVKYFFNRSAD